MGVYLIEQGADIDAIGYENLTPLAYAVYDYNSARVERSIVKSAKGSTPLDWAREAGREDDILSLLAT